MTYLDRHRHLVLHVHHHLLILFLVVVVKSVPMVRVYLDRRTAKKMKIEVIHID
jgi:hypothetical protein